MIFFVLSGYVLASPYYNDNTNPTVLHRRLWGRYFRFAIPVAASILISFVIYQCHGYFNIPAAEISGSTGSTSWLHTCFKPGLSCITLFKDILWRSLILGEGHFNPVCWSLKAEFIGSIYLLLFDIAKPRGYNVLLLLLVMLLMYTLDKKTPIFLYAILSGSLLNIIPIPKKSYLYLLLLGLFFGAFQYENAIYNFLPSVQSWDQRYFYNTLGALLLTAPIVHGYASGFFQSRLLQFLETISFPLYLLHFLVLCSFSCWLYLLLPDNSLMLFLNFLFYLLIAISISILFEKYVDQPAIRVSHRFSSFLFKNRDEKVAISMKHIS